MLDTVLIVVAGICMVAGIVGSVVPVLPGPPISYVGILILHLTKEHSFSTPFLLLYAVVIIMVTLLDYILPIYTAKRSKGSKYGVWGSAIGMVLGLFLFPPLGVIVGPVVGAFAGELISRKNAGQATKAAAWSVIGFLAGTGLKLVVTGMMTYHFVKAIV